jgi:2-succinyl-6-hydroxy-2,4-cyclohexadiene-1-carboxylate synthase
VYVGYSMGARLALHAALAHPDDVTALALLGVTAGIDDSDERAARVASDEALAASLERDGVDTFLERWLAMPMFAGLPRDPGALADRRRNTAAGLAASLRLAGTGTQQPRWDDLHSLTMPVLYLAGELDTKFAAMLPRLVAATGRSARSVIVPAAGHAAHLEAPEAFVAALRAWLAVVSA